MGHFKSITVLQILKNCIFKKCVSQKMYISNVGHAYTEILFVVYLKLKFHLMSGNSICYIWPL